MSLIPVRRAARPSVQNDIIVGSECFILQGSRLRCPTITAQMALESRLSLFPSVTRHREGFGVDLDGIYVVHFQATCVNAQRFFSGIIRFKLLVWKRKRFKACLFLFLFWLRLRRRWNFFEHGVVRLGTIFSAHIGMSAKFSPLRDVKFFTPR